ncbi:hypothetical protein HME9302_01548 [Alteripontixanthobacter maritimus]|uniref:Uncharacterized protein n=1 Tax=Alteripontixanthobacter maritimus TaxID=2161824 RepID=A0A369Q9W6_9SPHN|nr:hypothetical protein HME9302_01548 [Alteripontixanthobacter maritimus]
MVVFTFFAVSLVALVSVAIIADATIKARALHGSLARKLALAPSHPAIRLDIFECVADEPMPVLRQVTAKSQRACYRPGHAPRQPVDVVAA